MAKWGQTRARSGRASVHFTAKALAALGMGALLVIAVVPATMASAWTAPNVPCSGPKGGSAGLVSAINAANGAGGGTINLAPGCTYQLSSANNTHPLPPPGAMAPPLGANGLPIVTSRITINGVGTTIAGNNTNFRIFEVDGPGGNLTLQGLTLTGGNAGGSAGGAIFNIEGAVTLDHSRVTANTANLAGGGIASGIVDPNHLGPIGTLTLNFSQVTNNTSPTGGGGGTPAPQAGGLSSWELSS